MTEPSDSFDLDDAAHDLADDVVQRNVVLHGVVGDSATGVSGASAWAMRIIDIVVASLSSLLLSPVAIVAAVAIATTSRGPVIFRQQRVGRGGELFEVLKFRTMIDGAHLEVHADPVVRSMYEANDFKLPPDDPRITRVGRFLRRTSLDEVPQLVNVIRGEMSLVGVRPLLERELELRPELDQQLYRSRLPGLTGLWQVGGRSAVGDHDRFALDREYLQTWSVRSNLAILFRTPYAVLRGAGAH